MDASGQEIAYTALAPGTVVRDRAGEPAGVVEHVLADFDADIFDGLIIDASARDAGTLFADAEQIAEIREHAVLLRVDRDQLYQPTASPAVMAAEPEDTAESDLTRRLRRAWDWISGRY